MFFLKNNKNLVIFFCFFVYSFFKFYTHNIHTLMLNINSIYSNNVFWRLLFYLNNNNNSVFLFLLMFSFYFNNNEKHKNVVVFFFLFLISNVILHNTNFFKIELFRNNNIPLSNGILLIHPFCIYITYILSILYFYTNFYKYFFLKYVIVVSFIAIVLGSWWAQQELNWGGWWNWDYVELIALVFFLYPLIYIHLKKKFFFFFSIYKNNLYYYFLLFFIIVRCDILSSIHSFNSFSFLEKYLYYIFLIFIVFITYFLFFKKLVFLKKYSKFLYKTATLQPIGFNLIISSIIFYVLLNIFTFLSIQSQAVSSFFFLKVSFWVILYIYMTTVFSNKQIFVSLVFFFFDPIMFFFFFLISILFNFFYKLNVFWVIHVTILSFFFFNELTSSIFLLHNPWENSNTYVTLFYDFFQKCSVGGYFYDAFLKSSFLTTLTSSVVSGHLDVLYVNNMVYDSILTIQYDLFNQHIITFFKNFVYLVITCVMFIFILCGFLYIKKMFKVV